MFKFLKNKINKKKILAPSEGYLMDLKNSKDELFNQKILGDGFYVKMSGDKSLFSYKRSCCECFSYESCILYKRS